MQTASSRDPAPGAQDVGEVERQLAAARLRTLVERMLDDVGADDWTPAPADLDDLRDRLDHEWRVWRRELGRIQEPGA